MPLYTPGFGSKDRDRRRERRDVTPPAPSRRGRPSPLTAPPSGHLLADSPLPEIPTQPAAARPSARRCARCGRPDQRLSSLTPSPDHHRVARCAAVDAGAGYADFDCRCRCARGPTASTLTHLPSWCGARSRSRPVPITALLWTMPRSPMLQPSPERDRVPPAACSRADARAGADVAPADHASRRRTPAPALTTASALTLALGSTLPLGVDDGTRVGCRGCGDSAGARGPPLVSRAAQVRVGRNEARRPAPGRRRACRGSGRSRNRRASTPAASGSGRWKRGRRDRRRALAPS